MSSPFSISPEFDRALQARGETGRAFLRIAVTAAMPPEMELSRPPVNLALVLDRSGSMAGAKLEATKHAAKLVVGNLTAKDTLSVVCYDDTIETLVEPTAVSAPDPIKAKIDRLTSRGCTDLAGGWFRGAELVKRNLQKGGVNRVLLLTDGLANHGLTDHEALAKEARQLRERGITLTTLGFGADFNEDLLRALADVGGGNFFYIESPDQAPAVFEEELGELLSQCGQDLNLELRFAPGVECARLLTDYPRTRDGDSIRLDLGAAFAGESKVIVAEIDLPAVHVDGEFAVAELKLQGRQLRPEVRPFTVVATASRSVVDPAVAETQERSARVIEDATRLEIAEAQRTAVEQADAGDFSGASATMVAMRQQVALSPAMCAVFEGEMAELAAQESEFATGGMSGATRKDMMFGSYSKSRGKGKYKK